VFKVTTNGVLTTLVSFNGANGSNPRAKLVLGPDGHLYGTTEGFNIFHGIFREQTIFQVTTNGVLTTLFEFDEFGGGIGNSPNGLVLGIDDYLYGSTARGGSGGGGTIFRLIVSAFTGVTSQPGGSVLLTGTGPANASYRLWASSDLSSPFSSRNLLTSASFDSKGSFSYRDPGASTNSFRLYQLSVP
jgi:uncharacterized repeat protein (TIGR03803 family)